MVEFVQKATSGSGGRLGGRSLLLCGCWCGYGGWLCPTTSEAAPSRRQQSLRFQFRGLFLDRFGAGHLPRKALVVIHTRQSEASHILVPLFPFAVLLKDFSAWLRLLLLLLRSLTSSPPQSHHRRVLRRLPQDSSVALVARRGALVDL